MSQVNPFETMVAVFATLDLVSAATEAVNHAPEKGSLGRRRWPLSWPTSAMTHPQAHLCSFGKSGRLGRRCIAELVAQAARVERARGR